MHYMSNGLGVTQRFLGLCNNSRVGVASGHVHIFSTNATAAFARNRVACAKSTFFDFSSDRLPRSHPGVISEHRTYCTSRHTLSMHTSTVAPAHKKASEETGSMARATAKITRLDP
jgi:hypothetical protein